MRSNLFSRFAMAEIIPRQFIGSCFFLLACPPNQSSISQKRFSIFWRTIQFSVAAFSFRPPSKSIGPNHKVHDFVGISLSLMLSVHRTISCRLSSGLDWRSAESFHMICVCVCFGGKQYGCGNVGTAACEHHGNMNQKYH